MQIGADVYCDSNIIARKLNSLSSQPSIYPTSQLFAAERLADWADNHLFRIAVTLSFQPKAIGKLINALGEDGLNAFMADRAKLREGSDNLVMEVNDAQSYLGAYLEDFSASLNSAFILGDSPCIADFSIYHALWMITSNDIIADEVLRHGKVASWLQRMQSFGHGQATELSAEQAFDIAKDNQPQTITANSGGELPLASQVTVCPTDYGKVPVKGLLRSITAQEIVIAHHDAQVGAINLHFPRIGFNVSAA